MKLLRLCLYVCVAFVLFACQSEGKTQGAKHTPEAHTQCHIKAFATTPPLSVLLQILYPEGMMGLNYKPYAEDLPFMPEGVANLPVLGHLGDNSLSYERIVSLKPDVMFFGSETLEEVMLPYQKAGIKTIRANGYQYSEYANDIETYIHALAADNECAQKIKERGEALLAFLSQSNQILSESHTLLAQSHKIRPKVYFAQGYDGLKTQCSKEQNELIDHIGGINAIVCERQGQQSIDFELLAKAQPDVIFVREQSLFRELMTKPNKQWSALKAVENKRVYYAPSTPSNWLMRPPSIMQVLGRVWALSKVQPDILSPSKAKDMAQMFFQIFLQPLSDEAYLALQGEDIRG